MCLGWRVLERMALASRMARTASFSVSPNFSFKDGIAAEARLPGGLVISHRAASIMAESVLQLLWLFRSRSRFSGLPLENASC